MQKVVHKLKSSKPEIPILIQVAAYARVSCDKEAMLHSLSQQVSYYSSLIQSRRDWLFAGVFVDEGITGTKATRLGFQQLLEACREKKVDMVITKSITRFARNTVDLLETVRELKKLGVDVYFEEQKIHSMSGDGELMLTILASFAQEESRSVSENCKWRVRRDYKDGISKPCAVYGYRIKGDTHHIVDAEAEIIRMIFADYLSGMGKEAIVKKLNELKVPTRLGGKWADHTVREILRNERYKGDLLLQKSHVPDHLAKKKKKNRGDLPQYYVENDHPPIIDRDTFDRVQAERARRLERYGSDEYVYREYPFTRKMVCGKCGQHYRRKIASASTKYAKPIWICTTFNRLGKSHCSSQQIPEDILQDVTRQVLGLSKFDESVFEEQISEIRVPAANLLIFVFRDGREVEQPWEHHSRKWSEGAKQQARERYYDNIERGDKQ